MLRIRAASEHGYWLMRCKFKIFRQKHARKKKEMLLSTGKVLKRAFKNCSLYLFHLAAILLLTMLSLIALTPNIVLYHVRYGNVFWNRFFIKKTILRKFNKLNIYKALLFAVLMVIKRAYRESRKKTTNSSSLVYLCCTCSHDER